MLNVFVGSNLAPVPLAAAVIFSRFHKIVCVVWIVFALVIVVSLSGFSCPKDRTVFQLLWSRALTIKKYTCRKNLKETWLITINAFGYKLKNYFLSLFSFIRRLQDYRAQLQLPENGSPQHLNSDVSLSLYRHCFNKPDFYFSILYAWCALYRLSGVHVRHWLHTDRPWAVRLHWQEQCGKVRRSRPHLLYRARTLYQAYDPSRQGVGSPWTIRVLRKFASCSCAFIATIHCTVKQY